VVKALNTPVLKAKLEEQGFRVVASTAKQYGDFVRSETDRWTRVIKTANIRME
jgi:tripartite-type tricarboxylate transporter receptor subunit TctC